MAQWRRPSQLNSCCAGTGDGVRVIEGAGTRSETIIREIQASPEAWWNVLDLSGATQALVMMRCAPWRAFALTAASAVMLNMLGLADPYVGIALLVGLCTAAVEVIHRRESVTTAHLVRQWGLFGGRRLMIPLVEIERVEYSHPRFGEHFRAGDVEVTAQSRGVTFIGVREPKELADFILHARDRALRHEKIERSSQAARQ